MASVSLGVGRVLVHMRQLNAPIGWRMVGHLGSAAAGSKLMNSKRVACGLSCLTVIANRACIIILFVAHGLRLSNFDGGRNNGKPYFYSAKSMIIRIH